MPWGILLKEIEQYITTQVPQGGRVVDLLCGTGFLLGELAKLRPDATYTGVDLEDEFIVFASSQYPALSFVTADAMTWQSAEKFDAVLCTGGLHHLPWDKQDAFIGKLSELVAPGGFALVADPYIDDYKDELERKVAAAKLGHEYLVATMEKGATDDVIKAAADLIANDVLAVEFKSSIKKVQPLFEKRFASVEMHKTWPSADTGYGDYYFILKN